MRKTRCRAAVLTAGALSFLAVLLDAGFSEGAFSALAFPFWQLGSLLRRMSLSGGVGNGVAWILYVGLSLVPAAVFLRLWISDEQRGREKAWEDWLLPLLSGVLFAVLYWMINPGSLGFYGTQESMAILGGVVYGVLAAYLVLRFVRVVRKAEMLRLQRYMEWMLCCLGLVLAIAVGGSCPARYLEEAQALHQGNTTVSLLNECFLVFRFAAYTFPYVMDLILVDTAMALLAAQCREPYSETAVAEADRLARRCVAFLRATVLLDLAVNILQLVFLKKLNAVRFTLEIPLLSIGLALAALLFARYVRQAKCLKDENDLYI